MNVNLLKFGSTPTTSRFKEGGDDSRYGGQDFPLKEEGYGERFKFSSFENNILWLIRKCFEFQLIICHDLTNEKNIYQK
jgi:hypothetical protein